jgi:2'-5' RNA ligase
MRVFVAVDIPERIRLGISKLQDLLSGRGVREIRWARPSGIHLTLRFCGEISPETVRRLSEAFAPGAPMHPFRAALGQLETLPPRGAPRVLVISLAESAGLERLAEWVGKRSEAAGIPPELRRFHPHLTLGRFRSGARRISPQPPEVWQDLSQQEVDVDRFKIFQSHLAPEGSRYEALAEFPLLGEDAA